MVMCEARIVSKRPPLMKFACNRRTGYGSELVSLGLSDSVLRGHNKSSSSMLYGNFEARRARIVGAEGSCLWSFTTN